MPSASHSVVGAFLMHHKHAHVYGIPNQPQSSCTLQELISDTRTLLKLAIMMSAFLVAGCPQGQIGRGRVMLV